MYIIRCLFVALLVAMASARNPMASAEQKDVKATGDFCYCEFMFQGRYGFEGKGSVCPPYAEFCGFMGANACCYTIY